MSTGYALDVQSESIVVHWGSFNRNKNTMFMSPTYTAPEGKRYVGTFYVTGSDGVTELAIHPSLVVSTSTIPVTTPGDLILSDDGQGCRVYQLVPHPASAAEDDVIEFQLHLVVVDA